MNNRKKNTMDYRYETKDEARDFHKQRKSFIIINGEVKYIPEGSAMSHFEFCSSIGMDKETFNKITRGYYLNGYVAFYKDNFIYDDGVILEALAHINEIAEHLGINNFDVYFGQLPEENFALDYHYGKYIGGEVIKTQVK